MIFRSVDMPYALRHRYYPGRNLACSEDVPVGFLGMGLFPWSPSQRRPYWPRYRPNPSEAMRPSPPVVGRAVVILVIRDTGRRSALRGYVLPIAVRARCW